MTTEGETFVAGLVAHGASPVVDGRYVLYDVEPVDGPLAGEAVPTAVATAELLRWPLVPPHWIYLPDRIRFTRTNTQPCAIAGWTGHSRGIVGWGSDTDPAAGWVAHVRGILGEAQ